jgi:hypothetical protein
MPGYFHRHQERSVDLDVYKKGTVSTLLVPQELVVQMSSVVVTTFNPKSKALCFDFRSTLRFLLNKYRGFLGSGNLPFQQKPKLTFQEEGQDLQRFSFRPDDADWFEFGLLAYGCGVSRCWLFSYLLGLELSGLSMLVSHPEFQRAVTTANLARPRLILQIFGKRRYIHRRVHFRL